MTLSTGYYFIVSLKFCEKRQTRRFNNAWYNKCEWLTGSHKRQKLFCWPCLLFSTEYTVWSKKGFADLKNVSRCIKISLIDK